MSGWLQCAANIGGALSGVAAAVGVPIALIQLSRWRRERFEVGRGEAAARALAALHLACDECDVWIEGIQYGAARAAGSTGGQGNKFLDSAYERGRKKILLALADVRAADTLGLPYLARIEAQALSDVQQIANTIADTYGEYMSRTTGNRERLLDELANSMSGLGDPVERIRERGRKVLVPIARLERRRPSACVRVLRLARRWLRPPRIQ